ncbi:peptidoglycan D,D-transpeptidase FtsI family protein [Roseburia inulinivorans]|uniref:Peptidoglycan glycosyltransferase n=1 Tax=Roseburia inulinivorans TaxID=360807 RepID=A0A396AFI1_9FIRM|nr:penicillin-binding transpeptidase domain-containing protein [Roseburia inulinivorans]RHD03679.1 peptidoglycan glycosyltransferase [Roseburia inulinivorans]
MYRNKTFNRKKVMIVFVSVFFIMMFLIGRLVYLMIFCSEYYGNKAENLHERERDIKAARGKLLDANGTVLATNKSVCTISVIHNQIEEPEKVIEMLVRELGIPEETARKRVEKVSSIERVKTNVAKETGDAIRAYGLSGVKVDEDYKRYYPYGTLASKVLGFTGADNQGILGLEVKYDEYLQGTNGKILTLTDARGIEIENAGESRLEPVNGYDLCLSLDYNIQMYCEQAAKKVCTKKSADSVSVIVMNPQNGELMAMVNYPEFDLNDPFTLVGDTGESVSAEEKQNLLNKMWRNQCISDTYEPGSTFKIITAAAALEEGVVKLDDAFFCPGYKIVEDRRIRCARTTGHGAETFETGIMNSCNPVFMELGERLGAENFVGYFKQFGLLSKTNIDLPGEAGTIMHKTENIGPVELATISFGQSFQITPIQLVTTVSSIINGGTRVTPHFGVSVQDADGNTVKTFSYETHENICTAETSETMRYLLEKVVSEGTGKNAKIEGFSIGGKTATSQTLPRSDHKYISSFLGFAPADNPQVLVLVVINNPQGIYYGGTIAAPVAKEIFENILPYLDK